jgi:hypothetical protein
MRRAATLLAAALLAVATLAAAESTRTGDFITGGIGEGEREALRAQAADYDLWLVTAAEGSGAYLSDVHARVIDPSGRVVIETTLTGPWLLARLGDGRYRVEATANDQTLVQTVNQQRENLEQFRTRRPGMAHSPDRATPHQAGGDAAGRPGPEDIKHAHDCVLDSNSARAAFFVRPRDQHADAACSGKDLGPKDVRHRFGESVLIYERPFLHVEDTAAEAVPPPQDHPLHCARRQSAQR